jgi:hypothetical protein
MVDTSTLLVATDLADEGIETVLDNAQERGGLGGITVAAAYHEGRDLFLPLRVHAPRCVRLDPRRRLRVTCS